MPLVILLMGGRGRGIFGSNTPGATNVIDYITIATTGT